MYSSLDIVLAVVSMFVYVLGPIIEPIVPNFSIIDDSIADNLSRLLWITEDSLVI